MLMEPLPVYRYSGTYTGLITIKDCPSASPVTHEFTEEFEITTALLHNALPLPCLIPLQRAETVIGSLNTQRFFDEMSKAETKTERALHLIEHGERWQCSQGHIGVGLQHLIVKIACVEANHQIRPTQTGEQSGDGLRRVHVIPSLSCVIRHCHTETQEVLVLPPPDVLSAFLCAQHKIDMACRLDVLRCGVFSHAGEGGDRLSHQPLEDVNARLALQAPLTLTGITPLHGHAPTATMGTVAVEEDLQGNPEKTLMCLVEKCTGAVAASLRITEHRFHTGSALIDPPTQGVSVAQEQQRQAG